MQRKEQRRKTTCSTSNELEKASLGEGSNGILAKTKNEKNKLDMVLWNTSRIMR